MSNQNVLDNSEPLRLPYADIGVHTNYSPCSLRTSGKWGRWRGGEVSISNILAYCDEIDMLQVAFHDHWCSLEPEDFQHIREEAKTHPHRVKVSFSSEMDYNRHKSDGFNAIKSARELLDYTQVSLHVEKRFARLEDALDWERRAVAELCTIDELDAIYHLFTPSAMCGRGFDIIPEAVFSEIMQQLKEAGKAFELAAGYYNWWYLEPYNQEDNDALRESFRVVIEQALKYKVKMFVSSDAHRLEDVGRVRWCLKMAQDCGAGPDDFFLPPISGK